MSKLSDLGHALYEGTVPRGRSESPRSTVASFGADSATATATSSASCAVTS